jgi:hypothetical protein
MEAEEMMVNGDLPEYDEDEFESYTPEIVKPAP